MDKKKILEEINSHMKHNKVDDSVKLRLVELYKKLYTNMEKNEDESIFKEMLVEFRQVLRGNFLRDDSSELYYIYENISDDLIKELDLYYPEYLLNALYYTADDIFSKLLYLRYREVIGENVDKVITARIREDYIKELLSLGYSYEPMEITNEVVYRYAYDNLNYINNSNEVTEFDYEEFTLHIINQFKLLDDESILDSQRFIQDLFSKYDYGQLAELIEELSERVKLEVVDESGII